MPEGDWINTKFLTKCRTMGFDIYEKTPKFSFGWWFAYFFKEVRGAGASDADMRWVLSRVYSHLKPTGPLPAKFTEKNKFLDGVADQVTTLKQPTDLLTRSAHYKEILQKLFEIGFVLMPRETLAARITKPTIGTTAANSYGANAKESFAIRLEADDSQKKVEIAIGFRGDARGFQTIIDHEGALNRVDLANRGSKKKQQELAYLNLSAPWNPFSDPQFSAGSNMYLRRTSGDNCLFSVLSIGDRLDLSIGFPLIEDAEIYSFEKIKPMQDWVYADFRKMTGGVKLALVQGMFPGGKSKAILLATESHVYAVKFSAKKHFVHTQNLVGQLTQDFSQCPERGVRGVKLKNFLVGMKLRRVHFGPRRCSGLAAFLQERRYLVDGAWRLTADDVTLARCHFLGDKKAVELAKVKLMETITSTVFTGERTEGPGMMVSHIERWDLTWEQFKAHRDNDAKKELYFGPVA